MTAAVAPKTAHRGLFITVEGIEGCGKSTQVARLTAALDHAKHPVIVTREPGGTPTAEAIRELLLNPAHSALTATSELLLYAAARAQHVEERILPALNAGAVVLCDRYADSTTAYQGGGRGLSLDVLDTLHAIATLGLWPDVTFVLDVPVEIGLSRAAHRGAADRIEQETVAFHARVRAAFHAIAANDPGRVRIVDGQHSEDEVACDIWTQLQPLLEAL